MSSLYNHVETLATQCALVIVMGHASYVFLFFFYLRHPSRAARRIFLLFFPISHIATLSSLTTPISLVFHRSFNPCGPSHPFHTLLGITTQSPIPIVRHSRGRTGYGKDPRLPRAETAAHRAATALGTLQRGLHVFSPWQEIYPQLSAAPPHPPTVACKKRR